MKAKERESKPLEFPNSYEYLLYVKAIYCIKEHKRSFYGLNEASLQSKDQAKKPRKCKKMKIPKVDSLKSKASTTMSLSKIERKAQIQEKKCMLKAAWSSLSKSSKQEAAIEVPENFHSYTIQDRSIVLQSPKREKLETLSV